MATLFVVVVVVVVVFFSFKVYYFPILLVKAKFISFPSNENNYTFNFGPSELGTSLIDDAI